MEKKRTTTEVHHCGECQYAVPVLRFHTLSIKGEPTMAECPYVNDRCVLLSEMACDRFTQTGEKVHAL